MSKQNTMIDDGTKEYTIVNRFNEVLAKIRISPTDVAIVGRLEEVKNDLKAVIEKIKEINLQSENGITTLKETEKLIGEKFDYLFGGNVSDCFSKISPLTPIKGKYFCENVINMIGNFIDDAIIRETTDMQKRTGKYTQDLRPRKKSRSVR